MSAGALHEFARFGAVTVLGLGIDLGLAWSLATLAGFPLLVATVVGFLVAAGISYVLHQAWTFPSSARRVSPTRGLVYGAGLGLTLAVRALVVTWLAPLAVVAGPLAVLALAVGCSFTVNFLYTKYVVFRPGGDAPRQPGARGRTHR